MSPNTMEQEQELTVDQVAKRLGISYQTAYKRIAKEKVIRARREGLEWRVRERDLEKYIEDTYRNQHGRN